VAGTHHIPFIRSLLDSCGELGYTYAQPPGVALALLRVGTKGTWQDQAKPARHSHRAGRFTRPISSEDGMPTGTVKWFDTKKGFGFIIGPEGQDVFVHFSSIEGDGFRSLKDGESVDYDIARGDKGYSATRVKRLGAAVAAAVPVAAATASAAGKSKG
jgi:CspA family cold shock protein